MRYFSTVVVYFVVMLFSGCSDVPECLDDSNCSGELLCSNGRCIPSIGVLDSVSDTGMNDTADQDTGLVMCRVSCSVDGCPDIEKDLDLDGTRNECDNDVDGDGIQNSADHCEYRPGGEKTRGCNQRLWLKVCYLRSSLPDSLDLESVWSTIRSVSEEQKWSGSIQNYTELDNGLICGEKVLPDGVEKWNVYISTFSGKCPEDSGEYGISECVGKEGETVKWQFGKSFSPMIITKNNGRCPRPYKYYEGFGYRMCK